MHNCRLVFYMLYLFFLANVIDTYTYIVVNLLIYTPYLLVDVNIYMSEYSIYTLSECNNYPCNESSAREIKRQNSLDNMHFIPTVRYSTESLMSLAT